MSALQQWGCEHHDDEPRTPVESASDYELHTWGRQSCQPKPIHSWVESGQTLGLCLSETNLPGHFSRLDPAAPRLSRLFLLQRGGRWGQPSWIWGAQASRVLDPGTLFWSSTFLKSYTREFFFLNPNTFQFLILDLFLDLGTFLHPRSSIYLVSWILELSSIMDLGPFLLCSIQFDSTAVFTWVCL